MTIFIHPDDHLVWHPETWQILPTVKLTHAEEELVARDAALFKIIYEQKIGRAITHDEKMMMISLIYDCYEKGARSKERITHTCIFYLPGFEDEKEGAFWKLQEIAQAEDTPLQSASALLQ